MERALHNEGVQAAATLIARLLLALLFVVEGWGKIAAYQDVAGYMQAHGVPGILLPLVILTELGGGLMVAAGLMTRAAAVALAGFCILTAVIFHPAIGDPNEFIQFGKDFGLAGGFLMLALAGPGAWSLDRILARPASRAGEVDAANSGVPTSVLSARGAFSSAPTPRRRLRK